MTTVLVTGASGLVGRAVAQRLSNEGYRVVALFRHRTENWGGPWAGIDLRSHSAARDLMQLSPPDAVIHLASIVPQGQRAPETEAAEIRTMDRAVVAAAENWRVPLMYASTCGLYDKKSCAWKSEGSPTLPSLPYFSAKLDGEDLVCSLGHSVVARLSSPIGPGIGQNLVFPRFVNAAAANEPITLWGSGRREQDFVATADIANFFLKCLRSPRRGIFNVASGRPTSMRQLAEAVVTTIGCGRIQFSQRQDPGEDDTSRYCVEHARSTLGWEPAYGLTDMVQSLLGKNRGF